tara:strand:- start:2059 stop:2328 length:270 start_codon:yes stop_codon:yes gene_type:complete
MMARRRTHMEKNIDAVSLRMLSELQEAGCDAVVVMATYTQRNKSRLSYKKNGNDLLCDAMLRHAFHVETIHYIQQAEEEEESEDDGSDE